MKNVLLVVFLTSVFVSTNSYSQVGVKINSLPPNEVKGYIKPLSTWFGTYFNSGTYYDAAVPDFFGFKFSIVGSYVMIPDDQKTFKPDPELNGVTNVEPTATVFGNRASYYLGSSGFFTYPAGLALNAVPFGIYQFSGSTFNTELMIRFFPKVKFGDTKVGVFGIGLKHEISRHIPLFPIDVSVQLLYNNFDFEYVGNDFENYTKIKSNNFAFNIHASKTLAGIFIAYGGLQYESTSMDVGYYFEDPNNLYPAIGNAKNNFKINGDNNFRFTFGGALKLGFFVINADVNLTKFTTFTTGLSLDF
jgi:hypothetical protein